jgi:hypothetical protein
VADVNTDGICVKDVLGRPRIVIDVSKTDGTPFLQLIDSKGVPRLELTMGSDGNPTMRMFSEHNMQALHLSLSAEYGGVRMDLFALNGSHGVSFGVGKEGTNFHSS